MESVELHHVRGRLKLLQMRDSQAKTSQISFLTAQEEAEFLIPPHFQHSELLLWLWRALQQGLGWKMRCLGTLSRTKARKEPASPTPGTRKDVIFTPEGALCLGKLRRTANFPGSFRIFSFPACTGEGELAAPQSTKGVLTPNSSGPWFTYSYLQLGFGLFPNCFSLGVLCYNLIVRLWQVLKIKTPPPNLST